MSDITNFPDYGSIKTMALAYGTPAPTLIALFRGRDRSFWDGSASRRNGSLRFGPS